MVREASAGFEDFDGRSESQWHQEHVPEEELDQQDVQGVVNDTMLDGALLSFRNIVDNDATDKVYNKEEGG